MEINEFKRIVAQNIYYLRTANHLTQMELGTKLSYTDKAISKWERGDGIPDAFVLSQMAEIFGVSVDYLLTEHTEQDRKVETKPIKVAKKMINNIVTFGILTIALLLFVIIALSSNVYYWQIFVYAVPIICITNIVLKSIWNNGKGVFLFSSLLVWSVLATVYCSLLIHNFWMIFLIGVPLQIIVFLGFKIKITVTFTQKDFSLKRQKKEEVKKESTQENEKTDT